MFYLPIFLTLEFHNRSCQNHEFVHLCGGCLQLALLKQIFSSHLSNFGAQNILFHIKYLGQEDVPRGCFLQKQNLCHNSDKSSLVKTLRLIQCATPAAGGYSKSYCIINASQEEGFREKNGNKQKTIQQKKFQGKCDICMLAENYRESCLVRKT